MTLLSIRKGERRDTWAAFLTLFAIIASHAILETARDALFLAKVPASRLPWVFLAIAVLSFVVVRIQTAITRGSTPERALSLVTLIAGAGTLTFFLLYRRLGAWSLYALYVWSGLLATMVLVHFWALVGGRFTITQGKRLYGFIGAGSVLGAIAGSGTAGLLSRVVPLEDLLAVSAGGFVIAAIMPMLFAQQTLRDTTLDDTPRLADTLVYVGKDPYAYRVAASLFIATVCLTLADFIFKSTVAELVPSADLGQFLGTVYFAGNVLSLVCQLGFVAFILRRMSLGAALSILPALFVLGGIGVTLTGGLVAVLALKTTDGALRYSLHRTAAELLFLPFGEEARRRVKAFVDVVGQRGGQVLGSGVILAFSASGITPRYLALGLAVLASIWLASAMSLRRPYIELFRTRLKAGRTNHIEEFPALDVASLETLLAALESHNDHKVIAALDILERENKAQLIPALIVYHPSDVVVIRALGILMRSDRKNIVPILDRVSDHPSPAVRAAIIATRSALQPDAQDLLRRLELEESPEVRATIVVNLIASGDFSAAERQARIDKVLQHGAATTKVALANAIGQRSAAGFEAVLITLAGATEIDVKVAAITAMGRIKSKELLPVVVKALIEEVTRRAAERVLVEYGNDAYDALQQKLEDFSVHTALRWHLPPAMALCSPERAVQYLLSWLPNEPDGSIRFQVIRTLERLIRKHPSLPIDRGALQNAISETVGRAYRNLNARLLLVQGATEKPARKTPGHELLRDLLRDKEANARGRLFRLLSLLHPADDFGQIYRGLSTSRDLRATSMELIESILKEPIRSATLGLVDDGDDQLRLARAGVYHRPVKLDYEALLSYLVAEEGDALREVTQYHAAELGLASRLGRRGDSA